MLIGVKKSVVAVTLAAGALLLPLASAAGEAYFGFAGALTLPQGGSQLRHLGGVALRGGYYLNDDWAVEGEGARRVFLDDDEKTRRGGILADIG